MACRCGAGQADEVAEGSDIGEVDLGRLHQPLADVGEVRTQHDDLERGLQHREPVLYGIHRDTEIAGNIRQVKDLARSVWTYEECQSDASLPRSKLAILHSDCKIASFWRPESPHQSGRNPVIIMMPTVDSTMPASA